MKVGDLVRWVPARISLRAPTVGLLGVIMKRWHDGTSYMDSGTKRAYMINRVALTNGAIRDLSDVMLEIVNESR